MAAGKCEFQRAAFNKHRTVEHGSGRQEACQRRRLPGEFAGKLTVEPNSRMARKTVELAGKRMAQLVEQVANLAYELQRSPGLPPKIDRGNRENWGEPKRETREHKHRATSD